MRALDAAVAAVHEGLARAMPEVERMGVNLPAGGGQSFRPLVAYAAARALGAPVDARFWRAALAIQLAHEASLVHDDVVDGGTQRRGVPSVVAAGGVGRAVVVGDHLLTAGYRLAAMVGGAFVDLYAEAVERTVAGELAQGRACGRPVSLAEYRRIVAGKSGELLSAAAACATTLADDRRAENCRELGRSIGVLYQMLDDLLDYCPAAATGKTPLRDHAQRQWTWVLDGLGDDVLDVTAQDVVARLHAPDADGATPLRRALARYDAEVRAFLSDHDELLPGDEVMPALIVGWQTRAHEAVAMEETLRAARAVDGDDARVLSRHARSFDFAGRLLVGSARRDVAAIYAFCRFTDDLVDESDAPASVTRARLAAWQRHARRAYDGEPSGIGFVDRSVGAMRGYGAPFAYVEQLIEGVAMDLDTVRYDSSAALRRYTHGVASVVGLWLCRRFGVHDDWTLERAAALGHAMQLTNILRDVGADLRRGRIYIPAVTLAQFGLGEDDLRFLAARGHVDGRWEDLVEAMMVEAEEAYDVALEALDRLPPSFRAAVAVAAYVYRGIHASIRANGYDVFDRRAATTRGTKIRLAVAALARVRRSGMAVRRRAPVTAMLAAAVIGAAPASAQHAAPDDEPIPEAVARLADIERQLSMDPMDETLQLDRLRALYFVGVTEEDAVAEGHAQLARLQGTSAAPVPLLEAYRGAFVTLQAKHAFWPATKLRLVRAAMRTLDAAVLAAPDHAEIRYLRLISGFYLPGLFGRGDEVDEDIDRLTHLLAAPHVELRGEMRAVAVQFLLENAALSDSARTYLKASLVP